MSIDQHEYMPRGSSLWLVVSADDVVSYQRWFDTRVHALDYIEHYQRLGSGLYAITRAVVTPRGGTPTWLCFDGSNGHKGTHRYVWVYPSRRFAREQCALHKITPRYAYLSAPVRVVLSTRTTLV